MVHQFGEGKEGSLPISILLSYCSFHLIPHFFCIAPKLRTPLFPMPHSFHHSFNPLPDSPLSLTWLTLSIAAEKTQLPIPAEQSPLLSTSCGSCCACTAGRMCHRPHHLWSSYCCAYRTKEDTEVQRDW